MNITTANLKTEEEWRTLTGIAESQFKKLHENFKESYYAVYGGTLKSRLPLKNRCCIQSEEELLLFTLASLKLGISYSALGVLFGMNKSNAKRNQERGLSVLNHYFINSGQKPIQSFENKEEIETKLSDNKVLIIDATEQAIQRPANNSMQKAAYSGKKNTYR